MYKKLQPPPTIHPVATIESVFERSLHCPASFALSLSLSLPLPLPLSLSLSLSPSPSPLSHTTINALQNVLERRINTNQIKEREKDMLIKEYYQPIEVDCNVSALGHRSQGSFH